MGTARSKLETLFVKRKTPMTVVDIVKKTGLELKTVRNNLAHMVTEDYTGPVPLGYVEGAGRTGSYQNWEFAQA